jgi:hypothetical protein
MGLAWSFLGGARQCRHFKPRWMSCCIPSVAAAFSLIDVAVVFFCCSSSSSSPSPPPLLCRFIADSLGRIEQPEQQRRRLGVEVIVVNPRLLHWRHCLASSGSFSLLLSKQQQQLQPR